jgi:hypothetical protein
MLARARGQANRPRTPGTAKTRISAPGVRDAATRLESLAYELMTISDPPVRAVALVSFMVCEPTSPLYNRHSPVSVVELTDRARSALYRGGRAPTSPTL